MDEQEKELTVQQEESNQTEGNEESQPKVSNRSYIFRFLAGLYLLYTGYTLCKGVLTGEEASGWFLAAGIAFLLIAIGFLVSGGKQFLLKEKQSKVQEKAEAQEIPKENTVKEEKKTLSITERANLARRLEDQEEMDEDSAN